MSSTSKELSEFLRSCRGRIRPETLGLLGDQGPGAPRRRRVPGLRREEVARLAGVSVDYYTKLEQGRTGRVSDVVLDAVATALRLSETERNYLLTLAAPPKHDHEPSHPVPRARHGIHQLVDAITDLPAFVVGRGMTLVAMNRLARVVLFDMDELPAVERNLARWTFLDPRAREVYVDWEAVASDTAAILRVDSAADPDDRRLNELIGELSVKSPEFRRMWPHHQVFECTFGTKRLRHPVVGEIDIDYETFPVPDAPGQKIFIYSTPPGSEQAQALGLLNSWTNTPAQATPDDIAADQTATQSVLRVDGSHAD